MVHQALKIGGKVGFSGGLMHWKCGVGFRFGNFFALAYNGRLLQDNPSKKEIHLSEPQADFSGSGPLAVYQEAVAEGRFILQQCKDCGQHVFYPRVLCNHCGSAELKWVEASGRGEVYSTSVVRRRPEKGGPYNISIITLEEGPRMMSQVVDVAPDEVKIGMPVSAHIGKVDDQPAVLFSTREQGVKEW